MESEDTAITVTGKVKWFDPGKGFGFVLRDGGGDDVLLHANVLRNFGQGSVVEGAAIEMIVVTTPRGCQADRILSITPPDHASLVPLADMEAVTAEDIARCPLEPARIKWFDKAKGFGFANVFGSDDDIFVHVEVLRRSGLSDLATGEAIAMRVMPGKRGRMAIEVLTWDAGLKL
ncbi:cold-shock protein [Loktanella salsilacus]|jgi:CspA family cold shock protein|uniref:Cold-shock DNA-binding protein family n=1 Tax=Loktanella salsilacus TaxID=195913 RepID=A0A1I4BLU0_9RHOB|nr:cold shock domain-containing protein [Loktanella salsilacus]MBU1837768.1 cold shock domain-containing protein [Alphaproteobacteria bacterium]UTH45591.1 cold shock domain-containing protein [Loktanella salsilacus]UTH49365.1 cold shock domain-containing protein [Loktanella salsilacus]SFK69523.1 cold-shock DNA-binding protein family [Loktanella salsilacus]|tara:strand:- start:1483 stop:2007 length:525 start_codon:yes stop_codon:yes gene_type:complete